jgi:cell division septal protein FtsQ
MITRRTNKNESTTRAEAVRAKRKQHESQPRPPSAKKVVSQIRQAVEEVLPTQQVRTPRRSAAYRPTRRRWDSTIAQPHTFQPGSLAIPHWPVLSWRAVSFSMVLVLSALLLHMLSSPDYYINSINLAGSKNIPGDEIYRLSGVAGLNVLWLDPNQVKKNVELIPGIKSMVIDTQWTNTIYIQVVENEPVLVWSQGGQTVWVDKDGVTFPARGQNPNVIPIVVDDANTPLAPNSRIPVNAIQGALQLKQLRNNIELLHYDAVNGLSYQDGRNWRGYFGVGTDMEMKLAVYETLVANLVARGVKPTMISVVNKDAPYYRK